MRIKSIKAIDIPPIKMFEANDLSDLIVLAGPNGVGKTRLVISILEYFKNISGDNIVLSLEPTHKDEFSAWGGKSLDTSNPADAKLLRQTLHTNRLRRNFLSNIIYFESDRSIQKVQPLQFEWEMIDPWDEQVQWNIAITGLRSRFQDTIHAIFKKLQTQKSSIANRAIQLRQSGHTSMNLDFEDPLDPFRAAFFQLLAPKELVSADIKKQTLRYRLNGEEFDISTLSSGEREVLNITFDFILRKPSDCIVFFDEPDLHLHPELSAKLISTLKSVGDHNQFILCTHSPDIISSSLDDSVIFITPPKDDESNQGFTIKPGDKTSEILHRLGHSVGVISLGKKIVLLEGKSSSLDKKTYTHILRNRFPNLVVLPSGGKDIIRSFGTLLTDVLDHAIWGVDFYMLADRDAIPFDKVDEKIRKKSNNRFRALSKYHLENYFLDEQILSRVFEDMEPPESWLRNPKEIETRLREIATSQLSYATALISSKYLRDTVGNIDIMPKDCHDKNKEELKLLMENSLNSEEDRLANQFDSSILGTFIGETYDRLNSSLSAPGNQWKFDIPGRPIFNIFCNRADFNKGRLMTRYIQISENADTNPFQEIIDIFESFSTHRNEDG